MNFFGIGGLEFLMIFAIGLFVVGPKRLAEGVRAGRKYYTELKRYRDELTSLVSEAIDADDLKKELNELKKEVLDEGVKQELEAVSKDLALDQAPDLDVMSGDMVPRTYSRSRPVQRGDGRIDGKEVPEITLDAEPATPPGGEGGRS